MNDLLQSIDLGLVIIVLGGLCLLAVGLIVILQIVGGTLGFVFNVFELAFGLLQGGPLAWCGCLIGLLICGSCACIIAFGVSIFSTCGTPEAVNFCSIWGG